MGKLQINILGTSFVIQAQEDDAYLQKLLDYYKDIIVAIQKSSNLKDYTQISILAGITLVDELYKAKKQNLSIDKILQSDDSAAAEAERLTIDMINKIDAVLN